MQSSAADQKKAFSSKKYNYMLQGYNEQQAEALAKRDLGLDDTIPPPRTPVDKQTIMKHGYPQGHFDEIQSDRTFSRFDVEASENIGKPFSGEYGKTDVKLDRILKSHQLSPEEFFNIKKMYQKKGIKKTDEQIAKEISSSRGQMVKKGFSLDKAANTLKSAPKPFAYSGITPPEQLSATPSGQKPDLKQKISKLRIRREDLIKMSKMNLTESQIKHVAKRAVIIAERKRYAKKVIKENIKQQKRVSRLIETILEQEQGGIWSGIKGAIGSAAQAFGIGQSTAKDTGMQQAQTELIKGIKQAQSVRQKFNSQIMKNAELVNQYHDSVMGVLQVFQQVGQALGPNAQKIGEEINQLLGQFYRDLESEKQGIETYLNSLSQAAPEAKKVASNLNKAAAQGPQMGPGKTKVAPGQKGTLNPATAMSPSMLSKTQQTSALPPGQNQVYGGSQYDRARDEFERFVTNKYGAEMLSTTPKKVLDKAFQKFLAKKQEGEASFKYESGKSSASGKGKSKSNKR